MIYLDVAVSCSLTKSRYELLFFIDDFCFHHDLVASTVQNPIVVCWTCCWSTKVLLLLLVEDDDCSGDSMTTESWYSLIASSYGGGGSSYMSESYFDDIEWLSGCNSGGFVRGISGSDELLRELLFVRELLARFEWWRSPWWWLDACRRPDAYRSIWSMLTDSSGWRRKLWQIIPQPQNIPMHAMSTIAVIGNNGVDFFGFFTTVQN